VVINIIENHSDTYGLMQQGHMDWRGVYTEATNAIVGQGDNRIRPDSGEFSINLTTKSPTIREGNDWDGIRVELLAGETITITHDASFVDPNTGLLHEYYIGLDTDGDGLTGTNSVLMPIHFFGNPIGWEIENFTTDGAITYLMHADGFVYIGTGFGGNGHPNQSAPDQFYLTTIEVDDNHIINGTSGNDNLVSGSDADYLSGLAGNDTLTGNGGDDVLVGGAGNDSLDGGAGSDRFVFQSINDGQDTIYNFDTGAGGDIVNLDALFDALNIASGDRDVLLTQSGNDVILTIEDPNNLGNELPAAAAANFDITLDDTLVASLTNDNIVVDES
jgi:Ca2+-binding RTX toxin-like protein